MPVAGMVRVTSVAYPLYSPPASITIMLRLMEPASLWILTILILLPMALTMSLIWKIKEAILASVFGPDH